MDEGILSQGNIRSQENQEYNKEVARRNAILSKQIGDLQKQKKKIDTSDTDLKYSFQAGGNILTGMGGLKTLKGLGKKVEGETSGSTLEELGTAEAPVRGDIVKFDSLEEGPAMFKVAPEEMPTGTPEDPLQATPVEEAGESVVKDVGKDVGKGIGLAEIGEGLGIAQGADALTQDIEGKWSKMNTGQKVANVADIVGGVADTAAVALPFIAPVAAGIGFVADTIGDIAGEIGDDKAEKLKKQGQLNTQIQNLKSQTLKYKSSPVYSQIGLTASPMHNTAKITGSYGF